MADDDEDKTEEPTAKKLDEARKEGQIGRSQDLTSAFVLGAGLFSLVVFGGQLFDSMRSLLLRFVISISKVDVSTATDQWFIHIGNMVLLNLFYMMWPILLLLLIVGFVVNLFQVGLNFTAKTLEFKWSKIFSWKKLIEPFSKNAWIELLKGIFKMIIIALVAYSVVSSHYSELMQSIDMDINGIILLIKEVAFEILWKIILLLLVLGLADLIYQKIRVKNQLKMSKHEVKEETKAAMGDPKIISARRQAMMKLRQKFMMKEVPTATVVITNPTFIAIAIRYDRTRDKVPVIVAKGKRLIADRIREIANENQIPIVENKPLARGMYDLVEIGDEIPQEFYTSVAEVLAYVFSLNGKKAAFV